MKKMFMMLCLVASPLAAMDGRRLAVTVPNLTIFTQAELAVVLDSLDRQQKVAEKRLEEQARELRVFLKSNSTLANACVLELQKMGVDNGARAKL